MSRKKSNSFLFRINIPDSNPNNIYTVRDTIGGYENRFVGKSRAELTAHEIADNYNNSVSHHSNPKKAVVRYNKNNQTYEIRNQ